MQGTKVKLVLLIGAAIEKTFLLGEPYTDVPSEIAFSVTNCAIGGGQNIERRNLSPPMATMKQPDMLYDSGMFDSRLNVSLQVVSQ